jgi:hypothetical protein
MCIMPTPSNSEPWIRRLFQVDKPASHLFFSVKHKINGISIEATFTKQIIRKGAFRRI